MKLIVSIAILSFVLIASSFSTELEENPENIVHEGQCPSHKLPFPIMCRRRVCLQEELISQCKDDGNCATTHKCCRPLCSCRNECVKAVHDSN